MSNSDQKQMKPTMKWVTKVRDTIKELGGKNMPEDLETPDKKV